jgi:glycosyltransferase involved in cell wall biosynthesis
VQFALTTYPLSTEYRRRLEATVQATPEYLDYAHLRTLSPLRFVQKLRGLGATSLLLPIEDELSRCILPLLKGVAAIADAKSVSVVHPDLRQEIIGRGHAVGAAASVAWASAVAARDMARCVRELAALNNAPRVAHRIGAGKTALYINANLWFGMKAGGSIGHVAGVANGLADRGWNVVLAAPDAPAHMRSAVHTVPLRIPSVFGVPFEKSYYTFQRSTVDQLRRHQFAERPAFIYQRMSPANYSGVVMSRRWDVPLVLEYNGSEVWVGKNWGRGFRYPQVALAAEDACLRHADLVVTVSDVLADELVERGVPRERVLWYPNGVDPSVFDPGAFSPDAGMALRRRLGIAGDATVVMFIGTFGQWHGVDVFAQAIRTMAERDRAALSAAKVHFVLVGDGIKMPAVREALSGSVPTDLVTLTGLVPQADAPQYLAIADVVVSPHVANADGSRFFGSPTKLFEYMVMGKPIVASDLEQIGAILKTSIRSGDLPRGGPSQDTRSLALLCPPGDVTALVDGLRFIVDRPEWRERLGQNARAEALAKYTWTHHVSAILDGLNTLASGAHHE